MSSFFRLSSRFPAPATSVVKLSSSISAFTVQNKSNPSLSVSQQNQTSHVNSSPSKSLSQKQMMTGLGCSVFIDLCAEAMFFNKVPYAVYVDSLEMVRSNEITQTRLGNNIVRKGNKFGAWPVRESERKILVAHYFVRGDKANAKVVLQVEKKHIRCN